MASAFAGEKQRSAAARQSIQAYAVCSRGFKTTGMPCGTSRPKTRSVLRLDYRDKDHASTRREVEPLCLSFWGGTWTLGAWCRLRRDFRSFRPDRIVVFEATGEVFEDDAKRGLDAYLRAMGADPDANAME